MNTKATIRVNEPTWKAFRVACLERGISAGSEIDAFIRRRLIEWSKESRKA